MNKIEFLNELENYLHSFRQEEVKKIREYYDELIEEKKDHGEKEEDVIASFGDVKNIAQVVTADLIMERSSDQKTNSLRNFFIILGICATPILLPLGIVFFALFLMFAIVFFAMTFSFSISAAAILAVIIPTVVQMSATGTPLGVILVYIGASLSASAILALLTLGSIRLGKFLFDSMIRTFSRLVKKKSKGDINK
jgi:uncharacterized membrane protein